MPRRRQTLLAIAPLLPFGSQGGGTDPAGLRSSERERKNKERSIAHAKERGKIIFLFVLALAVFLVLLIWVLSIAVGEVEAMDLARGL